MQRALISEGVLTCPPGPDGSTEEEGSATPYTRLTSAIAPNIRLVAVSALRATVLLKT